MPDTMLETKGPGSRYLKVECTTERCFARLDNYKARMTRRHIARYGPPLCPVCGHVMSCGA